VAFHADHAAALRGRPGRHEIRPGDARPCSPPNRPNVMPRL